MKKLRVINLPVLLRVVKSLCEHKVFVTHAMIPRGQSMKEGLKYRLIHISVGLERVRDLMDDLSNFLDLCDNEGCDVLEDL